MNKLIEILFPSLYLWISNRKVNKKIKSSDHESMKKSFLPDVSSQDDVSIKTLNELYEKEFVRKEKQEDKAKTHVVAVTISVTLIMGAYSLIDNIGKKYLSMEIQMATAVIFILAVIYMFFASMHALSMIMDKNLIYVVDQSLKDSAAIQNNFIESICRNRAMNIIRSNCISASYVCIRNALVCLFMVMIVAIVPVKAGDRGSMGSESALLTREFMYSRNCINMVDIEVPSSYIEGIINDSINSGLDASKPVSILDTQEKLLIKFSYDGSIVNVYLVERYIGSEDS